MPLSLNVFAFLVTFPWLFSNLIPDISSVGLAPPFFAISIKRFEDFFWLGQIGKILKDPVFVLRDFNDFSRSTVGMIRKIIPLSLSNLTELSIHVS